MPADQVGPPPRPSDRTALDAVQLRTVQEAGPYIRRNDIGVGTVR